MSSNGGTETVAQVREAALPVMAIGQELLENLERRRTGLQTRLGLNLDSKNPEDVTLDRFICIAVADRLNDLVHRAQAAKRHDAELAEISRNLLHDPEKEKRQEKAARVEASAKRKPKRMLDEVIKDVPKGPSPELIRFRRLRDAGVFAAETKCWSCQSVLFGVEIPGTCPVCFTSLTFESWPIAEPKTVTPWPAEVCPHQSSDFLDLSGGICWRCEKERNG
jgi:rubrerythrin